MQSHRRLVPHGAMTAATDRLQRHPPPLPHDLIQDLTSAVTALLEEAWDLEEVAVVHHLSVSDLSTLMELT